MNVIEIVLGGHIVGCVADSEYVASPVVLDQMRSLVVSPQLKNTIPLSRGGES